MRELRVEDALVYLDQVKIEFGDRPHIYNEFLDIMKTFKTQQIDTPGVIRRVSNLFHGNRKLVLGFNTFLPEGYKIELPLDGDGVPIAVYRAPGQPGVTHIVGGPSESAPRPDMLQPQGAVAGGGAASAPSAAARASAARAPAASAQAPFAAGARAPPTQEQATHPLDRPAPGYQHLVAPQHFQPKAPPPQQSQQPPPPQQQQPPPQQQQQGRAMMGGAPPPGSAAAQPPSPNQGGGGGGGAQPQQGGAQGPQPPVEFDHAINYVTTIKRRFAGQPETYKKFLEILHTYQKEQRGIKEVLDEVSVLFADHPDLLKEFTYFLPDAVQAQAKAQLEMVAKESERRLRARDSQRAILQSAEMSRRAASKPAGGAPKQAPPATETPPPPPPPPPPQYSTEPQPAPFGATQGRSGEREREICRSAIYGSVSFNPQRPPKRETPTPSQAAATRGRPTIVPPLTLQPTTAEAAFLERAKLHLKRKELAPDKPPGSRRHTPYTEFLKCLHLFGAGILNKEELLLLLRGLFMQGHAPKTGINAGGGASNPGVASDAQELLREFEEILVGRGPYAVQEKAIQEKSKYGSLQLRDFDFGSSSDAITPSYRTLPSDYPQNLLCSHSGQTEGDASVLNNELVCIAKEKKVRQIYSPEDYEGPDVRQNEYEKNMFMVEDERFEVDMAIERNATAMRQVEPIAEEVTQLRENEEKDGQPIGRMTYKLRQRQLNANHINAIARIYGDFGDEVLQHLIRNPVAVLPIVYQRLRQKDVEWCKAKKEMSKRWNGLCEANYEGSLDVLCHDNKKDLERCINERRMTKELKNAGRFVKEPSDLTRLDATKDFFPQFLPASEEGDALMYQHYQRVSIDKWMPHKDAYKLLAQQVEHVSEGEFSRQVSRVWAEFMASFFGYEPFWILPELRDNDGDSKSSSIVRLAVGQEVVTPYGKGRIEAILEPSIKAGLRYRIALPFVNKGGAAYIRPESVLYALPGSGMVRKNDRMQLAQEPAKTVAAPKRLDTEKYHVLFANDSVYRFLRLYCMLVKILAVSKTAIEDALEEEKLMDSPDAVAGYGGMYGRMYSQGATATTTVRLTHSFCAYLAMVPKFLTSDMSYLDFETYCRTTSKEVVAQLTVLPKLVEKCADALLRVVKDDVVLELFDYAQLKEGNLAKLREQSLSVIDNPCYRIQYDGRYCYFSYVAVDQDLFELPHETDDEGDQDEMEVDGVTGGGRMSSAAGAGSSVSFQGSPGERGSFEQPPTKRLKLE